MPCRKTAAKHGDGTDHATCIRKFLVYPTPPCLRFWPRVYLVRNVVLSSVCKPSFAIRSYRSSLIATNREFLPLGSFDDRDLKQTQREQKYSYEEFINGRTRTESPEGSQDLGFGKGKRGQPLKIILRNSDPKADMILDLLVRPRAFRLPISWSLTGLGTRSLWCARQELPRSHPIDCSCRQGWATKRIRDIHILVQIHRGTWWCE